MRKWIIAVIIGVLLPYPIILLLEYLAQLQAETGNILYGYAQSALIFLSYFFLGVFLAVLQSLRIPGTARRFRLAEFVLGLFLLLLTAVWALEQATGLISALGFVAASGLLTKIVTFNAGLYLWVVMAGYFMTDAFAKVPAQGAAQSTTQSVAQNVMQSAAQGAAQDTTQSMGTAQGTAVETQDAAQAIGPTLAAAETTSVRRSDRKKNAKPEKKAGLRGGRAKNAEPKPKKPNPWNEFDWGPVPEPSAPAEPQPAATQTAEAAPEDTNPSA